MSKYRVGYGRVDITPTESVPLAGFGNTSKRMSRCVRDPLYASCFTITDERDQTLILISMDLQRGTTRQTNTLRSHCEKTYGIPGQWVMVAGTHTHAAPDQVNEKEPTLLRYLDFLDEKLPECVDLAMADRREADMYMGEVEAEGLNFIRHYYHTTAEGQKLYFGDGFGTAVLDETTRHVSQADPTVHIVKFAREGAQDLVLVNYRAHGTMASAATKYDVSADLMGGLRSAFEEKYPGLITYFQGAAGNVNPKSRILSENITLDCMAYGKLLADYVLKGMENLRPVEAKPMGQIHLGLEEPVNKPSAELLEACKAVRKVWAETNDFKASAAAGKDAGIRSPYQANAVFGRNLLPDACVLELNAFTLGDLALVTAPNELFDTNSVYVEDHAPFAKVLTLGYCNDGMGYIPNRYGFDYTCYESDCCRFKPGIGERIQDSFLDMLETLAKQQ